MLFKGQQIGKYKVIDSIGSGGFGAVYLATDTWIDKKVAIKIPHKQGEDVEKLLKEPRLLAALNHPHIVTVITAEKTNQIFYIVMEYVDGISLEQYLRTHKQIELRTALQWFIETCDALEYAHRMKIIHRDIRPANVLIDHDQRVKVTDFGTSRFLSDNQYASTRIGSPPYMAPEHFSGRTVWQSDIYSMGVLMYECVTGKLPFFDPNPQRMAQMAREGNVKPPHHHNPKISLELSQIVLKAMNPQIKARFQTARELKIRLEQFHHQAENSSASVEVDLNTGEFRSLPSAQIAPPKQAPRRVTHDMGSLFCWNCGRPISKRTQSCPHCNVAQQ